MCHSVKNYFSKSKSHSKKTQRMIKKLLSLSENLFIKVAFLTFAFRSKCRVNKSTSCKKKTRENQYFSSSRKNQYSSSSRKKNKRRPIIAPAIAVRLLINKCRRSLPTFVSSEQSNERNTSQSYLQGKI